MRNQQCTGPIRRRDFLSVGALGLGGLALPDILQARDAAGTQTKDTSIIFIWQSGGASQLETYDLKPDAPSDYRSVFNPISTAVPGMDICELFPLQAPLADRFSLVRSLHHEVGIHSDGTTVVMTGKQNRVLDPTSQSKSEHPDFGMVASHFKGLSKTMMPPYVGIPSPSGHILPNYLGSQTKGLSSGNPNVAKYKGPLEKLNQRLAGSLDDRKSLLAGFDRLNRQLDTNDQFHTIDQYRKQAFEMLSNPNLGKAFDLSRESDQLRDRYGRNTWGQGCLLARRLAEAGTAAITVSFNTPKSGQEFTNWDDHILNAGRPGHFADYMRVRLPYMDQALSALIEDVFSRSLDRKILIVVVGEFGRTPRLSHNTQGTGRNHWPQAYSAMLSGGGLKMGQVVGSTNSKSEYPSERPYTPQDLLATMYQHLGIDSNNTLIDHGGRPVHILETGKPIRELA
jgi:uncharacterized protein (DUF1501 family)